MKKEKKELPLGEDRNRNDAVGVDKEIKLAQNEAARTACASPPDAARWVKGHVGRRRGRDSRDDSDVKELGGRGEMAEKGGILPGFPRRGFKALKYNFLTILLGEMMKFDYLCYLNAEMFPIWHRTLLPHPKKTE